VRDASVWDVQSLAVGRDGDPVGVSIRDMDGLDAECVTLDEVDCWVCGRCEVDDFPSLLALVLNALQIDIVLPSQIWNRLDRNSPAGRSPSH
jgi:hypothetical protein